MTQGYENKIATCQYGMRCKKVAVAHVTHKNKVIKVCSDHLKKFTKK